MTSAFYELQKQKTKVVVVGGGTGTHTLLKGLKRFHDIVDLTAIVTMSDSGGSTGRLRDEFGYLPVGDVRMALSALSADVDMHDELLRELFLYRFDKGEGLSGHNFGNLLLTALTDLLQDEVAAIEAAAKILRVRGKVLPVTTDDVHLKAKYDDGREQVGEHVIDEPDDSYYSNKIIDISLTPEASLHAKAKIALLEADVVVFGPGDLFTSILPNCAVSGFKQALGKSTAKVFFISNLMTKAGQTTGMDMKNHVDVLIRYIGQEPDAVFVNSATLPQDLLNKYALEYEFPVIYNMNSDEVKGVVLGDYLAQEVVKKRSGDTLKRSLIRHDSHKIAVAIIGILE